MEIFLLYNPLLLFCFYVCVNLLTMANVNLVVKCLHRKGLSKQRDKGLKGGINCWWSDWLWGDEREEAASGFHSQWSGRLGCTAGESWKTYCLMGSSGNEPWQWPLKTLWQSGSVSCSMTETEDTGILVNFNILVLFYSELYTLTIMSPYH